MISSPTLQFGAIAQLKPGYNNQSIIAVISALQKDTHYQISEDMLDKTSVPGTRVDLQNPNISLDFISAKSAVTPLIVDILHGQKPLLLMYKNNPFALATDYEARTVKREKTAIAQSQLHKKEHELIGVPNDELELHVYQYIVGRKTANQESSARQQYLRQQAEALQKDTGKPIG